MLSKSNILLLIVSFLASFMVASANAGNLTVELNAGNYEIVELPNKLQQIKLEHFGNLLTPGKPMLPARTFLIALPPGAEVNSVMVTGMGGTELPGVYKITPAPPIAPSDHRQDLLQESIQVWKQNYKKRGAKLPFFNCYRPMVSYFLRRRSDPMAPIPRRPPPNNSKVDGSGVASTETLSTKRPRGTLLFPVVLTPKAS